MHIRCTAFRRNNPVFVATWTNIAQHAAKPGGVTSVVILPLASHWVAERFTRSRAAPRARTPGSGRGCMRGSWRRLRCSSTVICLWVSQRSSEALYPEARSEQKTASRGSCVDFRKKLPREVFFVNATKNYLARQFSKTLKKKKPREVVFCLARKKKTSRGKKNLARKKKSMRGKKNLARKKKPREQKQASRRKNNMSRWNMCYYCRGVGAPLLAHPLMLLYRPCVCTVSGAPFL